MNLSGILGYVKFPKSFVTAYPKSETKVISQSNYEEFVMAK